MYCIFRSSFRPTRFHPKMKRRYKTGCHEDQAMPYHLMELSNFEIESLRQISLKYWSTVSVHLHNILLILLQAITKKQYLYIYIYIYLYQEYVIEKLNWDYHRSDIQNKTQSKKLPKKYVDILASITENFKHDFLSTSVDSWST